MLDRPGRGGDGALAAILVPVEPIGSAVLGVLLLREPATALTVTGGVLIGLGLWLTVTGGH